MPYTTRNKGQEVTVIPTFREKSYPGERISQERWDEIFGKKDGPRPDRTRIYHDAHGIVEERTWFMQGVKEVWRNGCLEERVSI